MVLFTCSLSGQSGYLGKKAHLAIGINLLPMGDLQSSEPRLAIGSYSNLGYTFSDRVSLNGFFGIHKGDPNYNSSILFYGLDVHLMKNEYVSPVGKGWIIGAGYYQEEYDYSSSSFNEVLFPSDTLDVLKGEDKAVLMRFGHETRTPIKASNFFFNTQFVLQFIVANKRENLIFNSANYLFQGKIGFGIFL